MGRNYSANPDDYKLLEEVGYGASATVYRAIYLPANEVVAVKCLDLDRCNSNLLECVSDIALTFNAITSVCNFGIAVFGVIALKLIKSTIRVGYCAEVDFIFCDSFLAMKFEADLCNALVRPYYATLLDYFSAIGIDCTEIQCKRCWQP
ncbi:UNVERIFIED_CONTAM: Germinal center kinase [Sesamum latifolium]|uniref:Germinal center kinase n=1 Tax=Sesamum latifolium TaxID=2727402 RepID=A0AAW2WXL7_9LAMI